MGIKTVLVILVMVSFSFILIGEVPAPPPPIDCATGGCTFSISASPDYICNGQTKTEAQVSNDASYDYPYGLIEFEVHTESCGASETSLPTGITPKAAHETEVGICFRDEAWNAIDMSGFVYRKYGPTPDNPTPHWYDFMYDPVSRTGAEFVNDCVLLHFVDGARGDDDLINNNNVIVDQGGLGRGNFAVPVMTEWGIIIFMLLAGIGVVYFLRRQRRSES